LSTKRNWRAGAAPTQTAIAALPDSQREAITLYYLDGRNCAGVAAALGISEPAVRQRLLRGRLMLHRLLGGSPQ